MTAQTIPFYERIDDALQNQILQTALRRAAPGLVAKRVNALSALSDPAQLRDQARSIRAKALARLDELLEQLADTVEARGGHVCWANDRNEACRYILDLVKARGVELIVKSKSMVSEEIALNHALESEGLQVVETDLGEYIVQLAGEAPSHLIAPAVHKTREQIGELFAQKLGVPYSDDIATLAEIGRRTLRQRFFEAGMGISGANFGVARHGTVVLVTNEGNARLTTTLPRIHVAVMGIERVVETLSDLGVLLQVLARSATGQKLSVYTSMLSGPRRPSEMDGPEEFHLVLLDNGRSRILGSEYAEALMCIRCGACLNICPVYQSIGGHAYGGVYAGPIGAVLTPLLQPEQEDAYLLSQASSLCGACQDVCPVRIAIPDLLLRLRADAVAMGKGEPLEWAAMQAWKLAMTNPQLYQVGGKLASFSTRLIAQQGRIGWLPPPLSAWTLDRDFFAFARRSFTELWEGHKRESNEQT